MTSPVMIPVAPAPGPPLCEFVVCKRTRGDGEKGTPGKARLLHPPLEDIGFPRARRSVYHHVFSGCQRLNRPGLPTVRQHQSLQTFERANPHARTVDRESMPSITL